MEKNRFFLLLIGGVMELSWLYGWAAFLTAAILHRPFPFTEAIGIFFLASAFTVLPQGKGWRIYQILGLHVLGFVFATARMIYVFYPWTPPFFSQTWLTEFLNAPRGPFEWFVLILLLVWAVLFWIGGVRLAKRPLAYTTLCTRFDLGLAAFFVLFLTKFMLEVKEGIVIEGALSHFLLFSYFVLSLLAIGMVRTQSDAAKDFLPGFQGIGVILSFTITVLFFGAGLVFFFLPHMTIASRVGYDILKIAARPFGLILVGVLRFLFLRSTSRMDTEPLSKDGGSLGHPVSPAETSWWADLLERVLVWGIWGLLAVALLVVSGVAVFYLFRWLLSRTPVSRKRTGTWDLFFSWARKLNLLLLLWGKLIERLAGYQRPGQLYGALLSWGRRSGQSHRMSETPAEYGSRLKQRFPLLKREFDLIIESFNQEVYGERALKKEQWAAAHLAWCRLRSPLHWPLRMKSWLLGPGDQEEFSAKSSNPS